MADCTIVYHEIDFEGTTWRANGGEGIRLVDATGLLDTETEWYAARLPNMHGTRPRGARLLDRDVGLVYELDHHNYYAVRQSFHHWFATKIARPMQLRFITDTRERRALWAIPRAIEVPDDPAATRRVAVSFVAHQPWFFDPWNEITAAVPSIDLYHMKVPTDVPTLIGGGSYNEQVLVEYRGTWGSYPTFTITGPFATLSIHMPLVITTAPGIEYKGLRIDLQNAGYDTITVKTGVDAAIYDQDGDSRGDLLAEGSQLAAFHLPWFKEVGQISLPSAPAPTVTVPIGITWTGGSGETSVAMSAYPTFSTFY